MKQKALSICAGLMILLFLKGYPQQEDLPILKGPYLGQKPPGMRPELFAADIFNSKRYGWYHSVIVFSSDGNEAFWQAGRADNKKEALLTSRNVHGRWVEPQVVPLIGEGGDCPHFSPDGRRLYFISHTRLLPGDSERKRKENIWVCEKISGGWSEPNPLPPIINSLDLHWQFSVDKKGNLYFGVWKVDPATRRTLEHDIYLSRHEDDQYTTPEKLGPEINDPACRQYSPYISPDGDYLVFSRTTKTEPITTTMNISFKNKAGAWSAPTNINEIFEMPGSNAAVTPDGKYLFFLKAGLEIYWVDASFIEALRMKVMEEN
jgi:hypothetical protein